jgi:hypothetical protein
MRKFTLVLFLVTPILAFTQGNSNCSAYKDKLQIKDYAGSLQLLQQAINDKCPLTAGDYYNGGCLASLLKDEKLAFSYLHTAVEKGWENVAHMNRDTDLDNIRNNPEYQNILNAINDRFKQIGALMAGLKVADFANAIPYTVNGKWGWLNRATNTSFTKPVFDYAEFKTASGLFFVYQGNKYWYTNDMTVIPYEKKKGPDVYGTIAEPQPASTDGSTAGFKTRGRNVIAYNDKFTNVWLVEEINAPEKIGVATDQEEHKGIITQDGRVLKNFDFRFTEIDYFLGQSQKTYFITKAVNSDKYVIYDREGKQAYSKAIDDFSFFLNSQPSPIRDNVTASVTFRGYYDGCFKVYKNNKVNVLDQLTLKPIFKKDYDAVTMLNGPTTNADRTTNIIGQGISEPFFLVTDGAAQFYIDRNGKEYRGNGR